MISLNEIKTVVVRKCIHFLIAFTPALAAINYAFTIILLCAGIIFYAFTESFRFTGGKPRLFFPPLAFITKITVFASHRRDKSRFVLGPLTLGAGALSALLFFPPPAAAIAVFALAFGDGFSGLIGRLFGRIRPRFLFGKSIEGSLACFAAIFASSYFITQNYSLSALYGLIGALAEVLPLEDFDNIFLPFAVGAAASLSLPYLK